VSFRTQHSGKPIASRRSWSGSAPRFVARCAASPPTARSRWCGSLTTTARSSGCGRIWRGRRRPVGQGWAPSGVAQECTRVFLATKHTGENHGGVVRVHQGRPARHFAIGALSAPHDRLGPTTGGQSRERCRQRPRRGPRSRGHQEAGASTRPMARITVGSSGRGSSGTPFQYSSRPARRGAGSREAKMSAASGAPLSQGEGVGAMPADVRNAPNPAHHCGAGSI
jgi:hypothetical protein